MSTLTSSFSSSGANWLVESFPKLPMVYLKIVLWMEFLVVVVVVVVVVTGW